MSRPSLPDPTAVARGAELIKQELLRSMIMPRPAAALRGDHAAARLRARGAFPASDEQDPYAVAAGVAISLVDCYRPCWLSWVCPVSAETVTVTVDGQPFRVQRSPGSSVPDTITERFDGIWAAGCPASSWRAVGHGAARG